MLSKFAMKQKKFTANRFFTDRVEPTRVFRESIGSFPSKPQEVIVYYGKGGIGKTRLLQQLYDRSDEIYSSLPDLTFYNLFLSFDSHEATNEIDFLLSLRNKLRGDGGLFDYALISYWAKAKLTVDEITNKTAALTGNLRKILDEVLELGCGSITIPVFIVNEAEDLISDEGIRCAYAEEIDEIPSLDAAGIYERLPFFLGICFSAAARAGKVHVFFFDAYERIHNLGPCDDWFREFLASCESLRACIGSRDKLKWELEDEEWDSVLNQHLLENLSDEDSRWFLEHVPITDEDVLSKIVAYSGGVPLFLDMSVDLYQTDMNNGRTPDFSKIKQGEKLIDRYIDYLDSDSAEAVRLLAIPGSFDTKFALFLLKKNNVRISEARLHDLFGKSIVLCIDPGSDSWKIDESVRFHLKNQMSEAYVAGVLADILSYVKAENDGRAFHYFYSVLHTVKNDPKYLIGLNEGIAELLDFYGNSGYWSELSELLEPCTESENGNLKAISTVARIICIRRTGSLTEGEEFLASHPIDEELLGGYCFLYRYQKIQLRHLLGHYDEAIEAYRKLQAEMELIRPLVPAHVYNTVCMKYADLLFLKGRFDESLEITEKLLNDGALPLVDRIELMRIKGHIFRFQKRFGEARILYTTALKLIQQKKLDAYLGKLYTNLAEVNAFTDPDEAIEWFEKARLLNEKSGNLIELGKAYAACSVAYANLARRQGESGGEASDKFIGEALACADLAASCAGQAGYRSGEAFALVGRALAHLYGNHPEPYRQTVEQLEKLLDELNVYKYLMNFVTAQEEK